MKKPHLGILVNPASYDCSMACAYCYYRGVEDIYGAADAPRMSTEVVENLCRQYRALGPEEISITWQGGEPTLMGLDFFRQVVHIETETARPGDCWENTFQTNGVALDEEWCRFLAENHFLVGLSLDGPPPLNRLRRFPDGEGTYEAAVQALELLRKHGCEYNVLFVISRVNVERPAELFEFLLSKDLHHSQFSPCAEPAGGPGRTTEHSISARQYADFQIGLFDAWVENDDPGFYVRHIDNWLHLFFGLRPEMCEYRSDCSNLVTIEWNGDVYPCDFFVREQHRLGNVLEDILEHMLGGRVWTEFVSRAQHLPAGCEDCRWLWACHGGCYRHRARLGIGPEEEPYFCRANQRISEHVFGRLKELKERPIKPQLHRFLNHTEKRLAGERAARQAAQEAARQVGAGSRPPVGRNEPCPCGSGKKFKKCCMGGGTAPAGRA